MNLVLELLKWLFFIEGETSLSWDFLHVLSLKSSCQKHKQRTPSLLPMVTNRLLGQFFVFWCEVKISRIFPFAWRFCIVWHVLETYHHNSWGLPLACRSYYTSSPIVRLAFSSLFYPYLWRIKCGLFISGRLICILSLSEQAQTVLRRSMAFSACGIIFYKMSHH